MKAANMETSPYQLLLQAEQKYFQHNQKEISDASGHQEWTGVLFRLGEDRVLAPMSIMQEIVPSPTWIRIAGVRPWLRGLANVHGALMPVVDLEGYIFGDNLSGVRGSQRLLVINDRGNKTGVLVPEVFGMKHFWTNDEINEQPSLNEGTRPYISAALKRYGEHYAVFDVRKLFNDPDFQKVSV